MEKKGKKEKLKQKHFYYRNKNHDLVIHGIDKGISYIGYMIISLE
jgi:hypothetical protein